MRDLILQFIYLLPAYIGLTFGGVNAIMRQKKYSQYLLIAIFLTMAVHYYLAMSQLTAGQYSNRLHGYWIPLNTLTWLSIPILCGELFFNHAYPTRRGHILFFLGIPIVLATIQAICVWLGTPAQRLMDITTHVVVPQTASACLLVFILFRIIHHLNHPTRKRFWEFLHRQGSIPPLDILGWVIGTQMTCDIALQIVDKNLFLVHPILSLIACLITIVLIYLFGYTSLLVHIDELTLDEYRHPQLIAAMQPTDLQKQEFDRKEAEESQLCDRIRHVVEGRRRYTRPDYTIAMLAEELDVNRVYVSQAINHNLHNSFREYLNTLRIRRCKQMLREFPGMKQEDLAHECGFIDAPALNRKFKEIEGVTPVQWVKVNRVE